MYDIYIYEYIHVYYHHYLPESDWLYSHHPHIVAYILFQNINGSKITAISKKHHFLL